MACTGVMPFTAPEFKNTYRKSKVRKNYKLHCSCSTFSASNSTSTCATTTTEEEEETSQKFSYRRASPSVRWPHLKFTDTHYHNSKTQFQFGSPAANHVVEKDSGTDFRVDEAESGSGRESSLEMNEETREVLGRPSRQKAKKMTKLALKKAKDWRERVQYLTDRILGLQSSEFVADVLDERKVQMTPTDYCYVVKSVGKSNWQRALEVYEWLNLRHWYSPNARMLATIVSVLGKANQEALAEEIFTRAEVEVGNTVQVYNAMMGVYARNGGFVKVQEVLELMRKRGCVPDLVSFNTMINARFRSGLVEPNMAIELLNDVRKSKLRPDIITYNTLISACARDSNLEEAIRVYNDMQTNKCQPDLWTYNSILSVYGRCGMASEAERLFEDLKSKGFSPDAVTYNSLLYAFASQGDERKVKELCKEMKKLGFGEDEMTYNTIIHMYGKYGKHDLALRLYKGMQSLGRVPDVVTYTVLIDSLGKASKITEAAALMSEMLNAGIKPTLQTYSALMCGYAKVGMRLEAEETFECMMRSGINPDTLAYSVLLDINLRSNELKKALMLYNKMVRSGFAPDIALYEELLRALGRENKEDCIQKVVNDMEEVCHYDPQVISSALVKAGCYNNGAKVMRLAIMQGYALDHDNLLSILSSYSSSGRQSEALELLDFLKEHAPGSHDLVSDALILIHCKSHQVDVALDEYRKSRNFPRLFCGSSVMYESLIKRCEETELFPEASQIFSDMAFIGMEPSRDVYRSMVIIYCKMGFPETAQYLVDQAEAKGIIADDISVYVGLIEAYGKLHLLEKAESLVGSLRQRCNVLDRKAWNALINAYAGKGYYEKARAAFNTMMRDGPSPTVDSINGLMQALIVDGRLNELYVVIQELQDMGFKISKPSIILMLDAFAQSGNIFEVQKIYHGMKAAGYFPTMHLYRVMIRLFCKGKRVRDVEAMVAEMEELGLKPDLPIWNCLLKLYTKIEDFAKTAQVYQKIQESGLKPDEETYSTLILMYCRDCRPREGLLLLQEMQREGFDAKLGTYESLVAAFRKLNMVEQVEDLFKKLLSEGYKLNRSFYHLMMKTYGNSGNHSKAEELLILMKEADIEPTVGTMLLLMVSYASSGNPAEAEKVLNNLVSTGVCLSTLPYSSVIDAYFKIGDYDTGVKKFSEMKSKGLEPDHRIWTCFIKAASLCKSTSDALRLLNEIGDAGFDLPIKYYLILYSFP